MSVESIKEKLREAEREIKKNEEKLAVAVIDKTEQEGKIKEIKSDLNKALDLIRQCEKTRGTLTEKKHQIEDQLREEEGRQS